MEPPASRLAPVSAAVRVIRSPVESVAVEGFTEMAGAAVLTWSPTLTSFLETELPIRTKDPTATTAIRDRRSAYSTIVAPRSSRLDVFLRREGTADH
jgi:hypothetical protein